MKNNVRCLRERAGLSQSCLAGLLGVSQQAVGKWERGESDPKWDMAPKIADVFGCTIDALYGREPPQEPPDAAAS